MVKIPKGVGNLDDAINFIDTDYLLLFYAISRHRKSKYVQMVASLLVYAGNLNRRCGKRTAQHNCCAYR